MRILCKIEKLSNQVIIPWSFTPLIRKTVTDNLSFSIDLKVSCKFSVLLIKSPSNIYIQFNQRQ